MPTEDNSSDRVLVGRVGRPHGLGGDVVIEPHTDDPELRFAPGSSVHLEDGTLLTVARYQPTDRLPLVGFQGVKGRDRAEELRGSELFIDASHRRSLAEGEYWPEDLVGLEVVDPEGRRLGEVEEVEIGLGQDRLLVRTDTGRITVPFVREIVPEVDAPSRRLVVDLPEGLSD